MVSTSFAVGQQLNAAAGQQLRVAVNATTTEVVQENLIADTPSGDPERTIVVGAHLDSVAAGPGVNDNGSGSGTLIEMAEEIAKLDRKPRNRLRFAWWGAEEAGLVGSTAYVADLIESGEIDDIEANLNFDMLGSPNFVRFVYDGDNSGGQGAVGPRARRRSSGSSWTTSSPRAWRRRRPTSTVARTTVRSSPRGVRARRWAVLGHRGREDGRAGRLYGGAAGSWYDPCYHQACDTFSSVVYEPALDATGLEDGSEAADAALMRGNGAVGLGQLADGAAHAAWTLTRSRSPLVGPAEARAARSAKARRKLKAAAHRAARSAQWKGGMQVR